MKTHDLTESEKILSFEEFKATKKEMTAEEYEHKHGCDMYEWETDEEANRPVLEYHSDSAIEDTQDGKYHLIISSQDWSSTDLDRLEKILYNKWYLDEIDNISFEDRSKYEQEVD